jgi:hypothetical protein
MSPQRAKPELAQLIGLTSAFRNHITTWMIAVETQDERVRTGFSEMRRERWADSQMFTFALRQLLRASRACADLYDDPPDTPFADAVTAFESTMPHAQKIRNRLEHFDEYEEQFGLSVFVSYDELGDYSLHVDNMRLDLGPAIEASKELGNASLKTLDTVRAQLDALDEAVTADSVEPA